MRLGGRERIFFLSPLVRPVWNSVAPPAALCRTPSGPTPSRVNVSIRPSWSNLPGSRLPPIVRLEKPLIARRSRCTLRRWSRMGELTRQGFTFNGGEPISIPTKFSNFLADDRFPGEGFCLVSALLFTFQVSGPRPIGLSPSYSRGPNLRESYRCFCSRSMQRWVGPPGRRRVA